jgi:Ca-activated chloride channel family protein
MANSPLTITDLSTKRSAASGRFAVISGRFTAAVAALIAAVLLTPAAARQFTSSVSLVEVYATVTDKNGEPVTGLTSTAFDVFEEGQRQEVTVFTAGEMGLSVAVALDRSFSMAGERLTAMSRASEQFLLALRPADRAMLVGIGSQVEVLAPLATDRTAGLRALATLDSFGSTSLHDAIIRALDEIQPATGRRALVLLSDGIDRYSRASASDVLDRARRGDVLVHPIAVGKERPPLFAELASATGGRSVPVTDLKRLPDTLKSIATELRSQYLLGYTPSRALSSKPEWRGLRVVVRRPDVTVRARPGYWTR